METNKTHLLSDDGTLDTVLVCEECEEESRYNFDAASVEYEHGEGSSEQYKENERKAEQAYAEFVQWAINDADEEHECPALTASA